MTSITKALADRVIGSVERVSAEEITVLLNPEAPNATALNAGTPASFPRVNGYVLIPNESGATACVISSVRIKRQSFPKRKGMQKDFGLVDLPFPSRLIHLTPLGTLKTRSADGHLFLKVQRGVDVFPSVGDPVLVPGPDELRAIVEGESQRTAGRILLGHCPTAARAPVHVDPDKLFGRHLAVLGNTGAGKSCSVAGLVRWSIEAARETRVNGELDPEPNARFIVLDPNGEYANAFRDLDVRLFSVDPEGDAEPLKVPAWLWNGEEWAAFARASPGVQRPILFDALGMLRSEMGVPDEFETKARGRVKRYLNQLNVRIQSGDHQQRGKREGVATLLINLQQDFEALSTDPDCTDEDIKRVMEAVGPVAQRVEEAARGRAKDDGGHWHEDFPEEGDTGLNAVLQALEAAGRAVGLEEEQQLIDQSTPRPFAVDELPDFVDALAAGQSGRDIAQFIGTLKLRINGLLRRRRLASVVQSDDPTPLTLEQWLEDYIGADQADNGPIAVIDLSLVPSEVIYIVIAVLARIVFEAVQRYRRLEGKVLPTTLILEEAHTFIHRDLTRRKGAPPAGRACGRVFERIAREGRKFGLGLVLASQRPAEISPTVLSQCNTFLLHRIVNDRDQQLVRELVPDALGDLMRDLPSLPTQRAILLGWAAPAPVLVQVRDLPISQRPKSPDPAFWDVWTGGKERTIDWPNIARLWQRRGVDSGDPQDTADDHDRTATTDNADMPADQNCRDAESDV